MCYQLATVIVVIPCYNEAERLDERQVRALLAFEGTRVLFVDDGSTDGTADRLAALCAAVGYRASFDVLPENRGKAEAVRRGMQLALNRAEKLGDAIVGYIDADFATPPAEVVRLKDELVRSEALVALGSRVARLGAAIDRKPARHYLGRAFATTASFVLGLTVYDTQCGAKLFRDTPALRAALEAPFSSRWSFDVELLGRLLAGGLAPTEMIEVPLSQWEDVGGSKLSTKGALRAGVDLITLGARVRRRGRRGFFPD
ncbi:MAG: glycosyltransferase [Sandaracinaceae bacterium]|nr:MAG: glycosyltransferase [Sandaracinaceae bacterium]